MYERFQENDFSCEFHSRQNGSESELSLKRKRIITDNGQTNDPVFFICRRKLWLKEVLWHEKYIYIKVKTKHGRRIDDF